MEGGTPFTPEGGFLGSKWRIFIRQSWPEGVSSGSFPSQLGETVREAVEQPERDGDAVPPGARRVATSASHWRRAARPGRWWSTPKMAIRSKGSPGSGAGSRSSSISRNRQPGRAEGAGVGQEAGAAVDFRGRRPATDFRRPGRRRSGRCRSPRRGAAAGAPARSSGSISRQPAQGPPAGGRKTAGAGVVETPIELQELPPLAFVHPLAPSPPPSSCTLNAQAEDRVPLRLRPGRPRAGARRAFRNLAAGRRAARGP